MKELCHKRKSGNITFGLASTTGKLLGYQALVANKLQMVQCVQPARDADNTSPPLGSILAKGEQRSERYCPCFCSKHQGPALTGVLDPSPEVLLLHLECYISPLVPLRSCQEGRHSSGRVHSTTQCRERLNWCQFEPGVPLLWLQSRFHSAEGI